MGKAFLDREGELYQPQIGAKLAGSSENTLMEPLATCRPGCGACCIAPSISTLAKPAGVSCRHLGTDFCCMIFDSPERPACCGGLQPSREMCGDNRKQALAYLAALEVATS